MRKGIDSAGSGRLAVRLRRRGGAANPVAMAGYAAVLVGLIACGGGGKKDTNEPTGDGDGGDVGDAGDGGGDGGGDVMVPPEKMDEINVRLDRKRPTAARCLSDAILDGSAAKSTRGKITLEFVVSMAGKAESIRIAKSTLNNESVEQCVVAKVQDIAFPELPKPLEWSYTFSMDSN
jgi:hypothetical protein